MTIDCIPEQFRETVNSIVKISHELITADENLQPIVFLCRSAEIQPVMLDFRDERAKSLSSIMISQIAKKFRPEYLIFVSEAWMLNTNPEADTKRDKSKSLEHHPDRVDAVMYTLETKYGMWIGMSEIKTDIDKKRTAEVPDFTKPNKAIGRFANLLVTDDVQ
jgi:hypothetical protein